MTIDVAEELGSVTPDLEDIIVGLIECALLDLHTGLPARVLAFDALAQTCDVQPLLSRAALDEDDQVSIISIPKISGVPVIFPSFGPWTITSALVADEIVYLAFAERSIDRWKNGDGAETDPADTRKHALSDAIAIPGLRPRARAIAGINGNLRLAHESGDVVLELSPTGIRMSAPTVDFAAGGEADQPFVRGTDLMTWLSTHVHPTAGLGPPSPPTVPPPATILSSVLRGR